jgi:hypothetical protein
MAISIGRGLHLGEASRLLRDGLILVSAEMPEVLGEILPSDSDVHTAEIHIFAPGQDGQQRNRPNDLLQRLDLQLFGAPTRAIGQLLGFAVRASGSLSEREAAEVVVQGFEYMAIQAGFLDPRVAVAAVRYELELPDAD